MTDNADAPGADIGNQIHRVTGTARLRAGTRLPTLIVKVFVLDPDTVDPERTRPDRREYWKRVARLPIPMATAPRRTSSRCLLPGQRRAQRHRGPGGLNRTGRPESVRPAAVANAAVRAGSEPHG